MGAADGLTWLHAGHVLVRGRPAPILTAPNLEHTRIDLTAIPGARVGDEVAIIGRQGTAEIAVADAARHHGLALHQVAITIGPRVARVYRSADAPVGIAFHASRARWRLLAPDGQLLVEGAEDLVDGDGRPQVEER
jgi:alanine racemase-like protein